MNPLFTARHSEKFILDSSYEILVPIGRGRDSVVYKARCLPSAPVVALNGKQVALKVILHGTTGEEFHLQRTKREAVALLACRHQNVVRLIDYVVRENLCYLALEFLPKCDLRQVMEKQRVPFSVQTAFELTEQLLAGLEAVHRAGIVHRDIKPENLLVTENFTIKIADFGVAHVPSQAVLSEEAQRGVGTFDYLAPEALESAKADPRSDLYAAAVTLYQLMTQTMPFGGTTFTEQISNKLSGVRTPLPAALTKQYPLLERFFDRALASAPEQRFETALEFRAAVQQFLRGTWRSTSQPLAGRPGLLFKSTRSVTPLLIQSASIVESEFAIDPSNDDSLTRLGTLSEEQLHIHAGVEQSDLSDSQLLRKLQSEEEPATALGSARFFSWVLRKQPIPSIAFVSALGCLAAVIMLWMPLVFASSFPPGMVEGFERVQSAFATAFASFSGHDAQTAGAAAQRPRLAPSVFNKLAGAPRAGLFYSLLADDADVSIATIYNEQSRSITFVVGLPGTQPATVTLSRLERNSELVVPVQGLLVSLQVSAESSESDGSFLGGKYTELASGRTGSWRVW